MEPTVRAERLFDEAKRQGMVNPLTGDGSPSLSMTIDAIHDAEADGYQSGAGDKDQEVVRELNRLNLISCLAEYVSAEEIAKTKEIFDGTCSQDLIVIATALRGLAEACDDAAQFAHDDERHGKAEEFEQRAEAYRACYQKCIEVWDGDDSSNK
jgi:hypothetical protein